MHNFSLRSHMDLRIRSAHFVTEFNGIVAQAVRDRKIFVVPNGVEVHEPNHDVVIPNQKTKLNGN